MPKTNEATINYELARALQRRHPLWRGRIGAEQHGVFEQAALRPDIVVNQEGRPPIVLETEFAPARAVMREARERLGQTLNESNYSVELALAVQLPPDLREEQAALRQRVESAEFLWRTLSLNLDADDGTPPQVGRSVRQRRFETWPRDGWIGGGVDDLANAIECLALSERKIEEGLAILERGVKHSARILREDALPHFAGSLEAMAKVLHQQDSEQTSRMAMAIIANAMTFHTAIAGSHGLPSLDELRDEFGTVNKSEVFKVWLRILREINYWPIFRIASDLLVKMRDRVSHLIMESLAEVAVRLDRLGASSVHDLSGRLFQRLIADRKFLATFYTLPNSATLLAEIAVARLSADWASPASVSGLRIADLACGTGALVSSAYQAVRARHRRAGGDDAELHRAMMERALIAADIMPAATHLTASSLSGAHPGSTFTNTQVYTMPYGRPSAESGRLTAIGSLDLIQKEKTGALFGTGDRRARGDRHESEGRALKLPELSLPHRSLDLAIMNPPFTRPTNHESATVPVPSFAGFGTSDDEQRKMAAVLKEIRRQKDLVGNGNAGLASYFVDLAHVKARPGGVIALVLPAAFTQGASWGAARRLLESSYRDVTIVSIAAGDLHGRSFSADTGMAEVLVLATKNEVGPAEQGMVGKALFISLYCRPRSVLEAHEIARQIERIDLRSESGRLRIGDKEEVGAYLRSSLADSGSALLLEPEIAACLTALRDGRLRLPRSSDELPIRIANLGSLGQRGLLDRDIAGKEKNSDGIPRGPFELARIHGIPEFPVLWGHHGNRERQFLVHPDREGRVRDGCRDKAVEIWRRTNTRLHFNRDFQVNSQSLAACLTPEPSIGGRAWPNFRLANEEWEEPIVLWANTTLGLMSFWWIGSRQQLGRAILTISGLPNLVVLDPRALSAEQIRRAAALFAAFRERQFLPANEAYRCQTRQDLDEAVLVDLLGLPRTVLEPLATLRRQWCAEPTVHGGKSTRLGANS